MKLSTQIAIRIRRSNMFACFSTRDLRNMALRRLTAAELRALIAAAGLSITAGRSEMAIGRSLKQHDRTQGSTRQPKSVPLEYEGELPKPTRDLAQVRADLGNAGYAIYESALTVAQAIDCRNIL